MKVRSLIGPPWATMAEPEQAAAIALAQQEGRRLARRRVAAGDPGMLGGNPERGRAGPKISAVSDPAEDEGRVPAAKEEELAFAWFVLWGDQILGLRPSEWLEEVLDPRCYHLAASFELELCRLRGNEAPLHDVPALEAALREAKEVELRRSRDVYEAVTSVWPVGGAEREQVVAAYEEALAETNRTLLFLQAARDAPSPTAASWPVGSLCNASGDDGSAGNDNCCEVPAPRRHNGKAPATPR